MFVGGVPLQRGGVAAQLLVEPGLRGCVRGGCATLIARRSLRDLCTRLGERHLMLDPGGEPKARAALRKLGYPLGRTTC